MKVYAVSLYDEYYGWELVTVCSTFEKAKDFLRPMAKEFSERYDDEEAKEIMEEFEDNPCYVDSFCKIDDYEVD